MTAAEGGGGSRPGGQLNGMPSKKSHSTSKLSGKGEQGKYAIVGVQHCTLRQTEGQPLLITCY